MAILETILKGAGSVFSGAGLGVVGAIGSGVVTILQRKQQNAHDLAVMGAQLEAAKAAGNNLAVLEGIKLQSSSYDHDKATYENAGVIDMLRGSVRPVITYFLVIMVTFLGFWAFKRIGLSDPVISEIAVMCVRMCIELASICVVWWFGGRYFSKTWSAK